MGDGELWRWGGDVSYVWAVGVLCCFVDLLRLWCGCKIVIGLGYFGIWCCSRAFFCCLKGCWCDRPHGYHSVIFCAAEFAVAKLWRRWFDCCWGLGWGGYFCFNGVCAGFRRVLGRCGSWNYVRFLPKRGRGAGRERCWAMLFLELFLVFAQTRLGVWLTHVALLLENSIDRR